MPTLLVFSLLQACDRTPPATDGGFTATFGDDPGGDDDDDGVGGTEPGDDDDTPTADCEEVDADGDGSNACDDCDDDDAASFPGAEERCDQRDNDCDGAPDPDETAFDCTACDAAGFWQPTRGLAGSGLVNTLHGLTAGQSCNDYSTETTFMFVDLDNRGGEVECVYTGRTTPIVGGNKPDATDMNTEHTWPQSLGAENEPAKCDLHHLYPTDSDTNNLRANYPFGEVVTDTADVDGGSRFGRDAGGDTVFEPRDAHKGNTSRSMLYFAMRYGFPVSSGDLQTYQAWSAADPVDDAELERTTRIAERQGVANPYVVCPWLVDSL
jgi:hypothetical protein